MPDKVDPNAAPAAPATPAPGSPEADAAAIALFDAAMAADPDSVQPLPTGEPPDTKAAAPAAEEPPPEGQEKPPEGEAAADETPATGEPAPATGEPAPAAAAAPKPPVAAKPDAAIEQEIADRGLKGDTATRFRELSNQVRELSPLREEIPRLREVERLHDQWQGIVADSTATAPQLEQALAYIQSVNSGDPERLGLAAKAMMQEVTWAYKKLGWELPGVIDPLEDHPDLVTLVNDGDITRTGALEIVKSRATKAAHDAREQSASRATQQEDEYNAALAAVGPQIDALSEHLKKTDPLFLAKLPSLKPTVDLIKETLHPSRWPRAIEAAYRKLPNPVVPARPGPVKPMPLRPTGGGNAATTTVRKFTKEQIDAGDPFDMGVKEAMGR